MITHLEPAILEFEVQGALGSITTDTAGGVFILLDLSELSLESRIEVYKVSISLSKVLSIIPIFNRGPMQI